MIKKKLEKLKAELEAETGELARLRQQREDVDAQITELNADREVVVRLAAKDDDKAAERAQEIGAEITRLRVRLDGFTGLISDLEGEIGTLQQKIEQEEAAYSDSRMHFVEAGLRKQAQELLDGLPARKEKFFELFAQLRLALGEFHRDDAFTAQILNRHDFHDFIHNLGLDLAQKFHDAGKDPDIRKLSVYPIDIKLGATIGGAEPHLRRCPSPEDLGKELIAAHQLVLDAEFAAK